MFQRCVSLLLIAAFFASQLAAIPHAHGMASAEDRQKHNSAPHFHCTWFARGNHDHDHDHGRSHHERRHSDSGHRIAEGSTPYDHSDGQPWGIGLNDVDHDANAIVIPGQTCAAATTSHKDLAILAWHSAALTPLPDCFGDLQASLRPSPRWHPPDKVLDASDSYLTLRNLRI